MRVPVSWLRDYVAIEMPLPELAARLSVSTAEVEGIERRGVADEGGNLGLFKVGRVVEAEKHPNADRLQITKVDVGEGEPRSIVCGAWNFGVGATVGVALPGATLPNGLTLDRREVRGLVSDGMILAEDEIGLGADHAGIMLLPETEAGTPLSDLLPLSEDVLIVEATGNRPDLQSVYGIAREIATLYDLPLSEMSRGQSPGHGPERQVAIRIDDFSGCPRYVGRLFENVVIAPSPQWLRSRLFLAGQRPISNVVDITNYVMLALGNPLHAFDYSTLRGAQIIVRRAAAGERLTTLDGTERTLAADDLVIADADRAIALAGIMGGEETEIGEGTTSVLLEAANFEPYGIYRTSERQHLRTEGSNRWEKGVDPYLAATAADVATTLVLELAGATWTAAADVQGELPKRPEIAFRPERADALIGVETPAEHQYALLDHLGFNRRDDGAVLAPTWRARDVTREVDVIEEIARFRLEDVPFTLPARREMHGLLTREQQLRRRVEDALAGLGFAEIYTPSLRPDEETTWKLPEPISVELTALRTSLIPSLVEAARRNIDAGAKSIALFEIARVYLPAGELPNERLHVAGLVEGGFLRVKGVVETLYAALKAEPAFERTTHPQLHPGKAAKTPAGIVGEVHPRELDGAWGAFELDLEELFSASHEPVVYRDVITYPAVRQDIAVAVAEDVPAGELVAAAREAAGEELREIRVFDVYRGDQVGEGRKSVAFSVAYQSAERTLTEEDAARLRTRILEALAARFGADQR
ncbi:MAG TPA: phenylalanine--tRNA ligase subunit beta [Gaiellaceae bacterium]|jgi:phenylalanyl-tRNA synthetase beta chain|nr:phenylalanine--tRNA ligase subunit beta [Gaiellaceae bacterium]